MKVLRNIVCLLVVVSCFPSCMKDDVVFGQVLTYEVDTTQVFATTAICRGEVKTNFGEDSNAKMIETGILYSENEQDMADSIPSTQGASVSPFTCYLMKLKPQTQYYVRAYAIITCKYSQGTYQNVLLGEIKKIKTKEGYDDDDSKMPAPRNVQAKQAGETIFITWNVYGENNYLWKIVEKSNNENGSYTILDTIIYNYFTDETPLDGLNYYRVKLREQYPLKESNYTYAPPCNFIPPTIETPTLAPPTVLSANQIDNYVELTWVAVEAADDYFIYRSSTQNGNYAQKGRSGKSTSWIDNFPLSGDNYYKIKSANASMPNGSEFSEYLYCPFYP